MESIEQKENFIPKKEKREFIATPTNGDKPRKFEAEYEEIRPNVWQMVVGTLKDLGSTQAEK